MDDTTDTARSEKMNGLIEDWRAMIIMNKRELGRPKCTLLPLITLLESKFFLLIDNSYSNESPAVVLNCT